MTDRQAKLLTRVRLIRYFVASAQHRRNGRIYREIDSNVEWWHTGKLQWVDSTGVDVFTIIDNPDRFIEITEPQVHERQRKTVLFTIQRSVEWLKDNL